MTNSEDIARGLKSPRSRHGVTNSVDWMGCDAELLQKVIATASSRHCAIRFGLTRDGGAYAIGVYSPGDYFTDYVRPSEDIDEYLRDLLIELDEFIPGDAVRSKSGRPKKA